MTLILLGSFALTACESPDKWSPDKALDRRDQREMRSWVQIDNKQALDSDYKIANAIREASPYTHAKKNKSSSDNSFTYSLDVNGYIFPKNCLMTFYDDGYVEVKSGDDVSFVYSFGAQKAKTLYQVVATYIEEANTGTLPVEPEINDIIALGRGKEGNQKDKDGNEIFTLDEFKDVTFTLKTSNGSNGALFVNNTEIESSLFTSMYIFASDINRDGYRELIYDRNEREGESRGNYFVVYDVKNMKVLFDEVNTRVGSYAFYRFNYGMVEEKLTFYPYIGNYSENSIVDYGYLRYTEEKGAYFEWQNIFAITSIELVRFYINKEGYPSIEPVNNVYTFHKGIKCSMEYKVNRTNNNRQLIGGFLSVYWDNAHPSHFNRYLSADYPDINNVYTDTFDLSDECEESTWEFFFGEFGFDVHYKIEA